MNNKEREMMKVKVQMLVMTMIVAMFTFSACSSDDDDHSITVPDAVAKALKQKYPDASGIEWSLKKTHYVADCWMDGKEMDVWYDANASWQMTEIDIQWTNIPAAVQTTFSEGEYAGWKKEDFSLLQYPLNPMQYVIEVEQGKQELQLFYSEDGELMDEVDVAGKDDTIYPPAAN